MASRNKLIGASAAAVAAFALAAPGASAAELFAGTAGKERLVVFSSKNPAKVDAARVRGLAAGDRITGLDVRPCTRRVYGQGTAQGTSRLHQLRLRVREGRTLIGGEVRARRRQGPQGRPHRRPGADPDARDARTRPLAGVETNRGTTAGATLLPPWPSS